MDIAISNIAWNKEDDHKVYSLMKELGISGLEISPYRIWEDPFNVGTQDVKDYIAMLKDEYNIEVVGMQALLFGHTELRVFGTDMERIEIITYLKKVIDFASNFGNIPLVFGSPKNRIIGQMDQSLARKIYLDLFTEIGNYASLRGVKMCIEANPKDYGADFINNLSEADQLVSDVNSAGLCLHIDTGELILNGARPTILGDLKNLPAHYHISEPFLSEDYKDDNFHKNLNKELQKIKYNGYVSIEMSPKQKNVDILEKISAAIEFAKQCYIG